MGGIYERDCYKAGLRAGESDQDGLYGEFIKEKGKQSLNKGK